MNGYMGKILRVNLTTRGITEEPLKAKLARDYIGGTGLGDRIIYDEVPPSTDPLSPENKMVFTTGPVTATNFPSSARFQICFKSPLTGILCDASSGGYWGTDFKRAGYDALIIEGASDVPVYLWIHNGKVEIRNASHLWGEDALKTQDTLRRNSETTRSASPASARLGRNKSSSPASSMMRAGPQEEEATGQSLGQRT